MSISRNNTCPTKTPNQGCDRSAADGGFRGSRGVLRVASRLPRGGDAQSARMRQVFPVTSLLGENALILVVPEQVLLGPIGPAISRHFQTF